MPTVKEIREAFESVPAAEAGDVHPLLCISEYEKFLNVIEMIINKLEQHQDIFDEM